ncbi:lipase [Lithospermum erythrorhizon]|uniref:Lipase n=1 Tax=Lithospermum erythrorhizon TaxID=34254 RepID=A0AAV3RPX3_LITER
MQGLDPRSTANLFSNSICIGEKKVNSEDCFVLKLEAESSVLKARSSRNVEMISHTIWGYFSQRSGLLIQLEDTHILRICSSTTEVFWETTMESQIQDYRTIDGVNIAHGGRTGVSLYRYGENSEGHTRTRMEEFWTIEEVDFNIKGLSVDCFLPPGDLKKEEETCRGVETDGLNNLRLPFKVVRANAVKVNGARNVAKVVAVDEDVLQTVHEDDEF